MAVPSSDQSQLPGDSRRWSVEDRRRIARESDVPVHRDGVVAATERVRDHVAQRPSQIRPTPRQCIVVRAQPGSRVELEPGRPGVRPTPEVPGAPGHQRGLGCPAGVNSGTLPAMTTTSKVRPRSRSATSPSSSRVRARAGGRWRSSTGRGRRRRRGIPRRASSMATLPLPHPASRTEDGSERGDEVSFAVHVDPGGGQVVEALLVACRPSQGAGPLTARRGRG